MSDEGSDIFTSVLAVTKIKKQIKALRMRTIKVRVISNNKLFEDLGTIKYGYCMFNTIERAYRANDILTCDKSNMFLVDENKLSYDSWELYKILKTRVIQLQEFDNRATVIQFILGIIIGGSFGALGGVLGMIYVFIIIAILILYKMVVGATRV